MKICKLPTANVRFDKSAYIYILLLSGATGPVSLFLWYFIYILKKLFGINENKQNVDTQNFSTTPRRDVDVP